MGEIKLVLNMHVHCICNTGHYKEMHAKVHNVPVCILDLYLQGVSLYRSLTSYTRMVTAIPLEC